MLEILELTAAIRDKVKAAEESRLTVSGKIREEETKRQEISCEDKMDKATKLYIQYGEAWLSQDAAKQREAIAKDLAQCNLEQNDLRTERSECISEKNNCGLQLEGAQREKESAEEEAKSKSADAEESDKRATAAEEKLEEAEKKLSDLEERVVRADRALEAALKLSKMAESAAGQR